MKTTATGVRFLGLLLTLCVIGASFASNSRSANGESRQIIAAEDHANLQAAFDALGGMGGVVRIPPGVFEISEPLTISTEDVLIEGCGTATHIKNVNQDGKPALIAVPPSKKSLWRVKLSNFRITGSKKSGHGIVARKVDEFFVQGVTVSYHGGHGIFLDGCYEDPRISDSLISYNKQTGLEIFNCHDIVVSANHFEENRDAVTCKDSFNLCMSGNNLDDHLRDGVTIENTYGSIVSSNMVEECKGTALILDRDCYGITLSANVIAHHQAGGIDLRDAHGCTVSANTFTLVRGGGLKIGPGSGRITVTGNNFSDSYMGDGQEKRKPNDRTATGIVLEKTADIAISGNVFSGLDSKAIDYNEAECKNILLSGNVIAETADENVSR